MRSVLVLLAALALFGWGYRGWTTNPAMEPPGADRSQAATGLPDNAKKAASARRAAEAERLRAKITDAVTRLEADGISRDDLKDYFRNEIEEELRDDAAEESGGDGPEPDTRGR